MRKCKYYFVEQDGSKSFTYDELIERIQEDPIESLSILFSLEPDKQANIVDKVCHLNKEYAFAKKTRLNSDPDVNAKGSYTVQTFMDSGKVLVDGKPPMFQMNDDDFKETMKKKYEQTMSEEEAQAKVDKIVSVWDDVIAKDATDLHRIIVSHNSNDSDIEFSKSCADTRFSYISDEVKMATQEVERQIWQRNRTLGEEHSHLVRNINLEAKIRGEIEKIVGHIDYMMVKPDGTIEIYNIKASIENENDWSPAKKEKYKYGLALIKRILEYNGIDASNIRVNLIPIRLKYDDDFDNLLEINVGEYKSYDLKDSHYVFEKYDKFAAQYIDSKCVIDNFNDDVLVGVNANLAKIFAGRGIDVFNKGIKKSAKGWVKENWRSIAKEPKDGTKGWEITLPDESKPIKISDTRIGDKNEELVNLIASKEEELFGSTANEKSVRYLIDDIKESFRQKLRFLSTSSSKGGTYSLISTNLNKYFESSNPDPSAEPEYKWELIDNTTLTNSNIIMFRHKITNLVDIIDLTPYDVTETDKAKGRKNLLGFYLPDLNNENFIMESNYGNIEAIRTLTLVNELIPKLNFQPKFGTLKVLSMSRMRNKKGCEFDMAQLLPLFLTIIKVVKESDRHFNIKNNFKPNGVIDPTELLLQTWREVMTDYPDINLSDLKDLGDDFVKKVKADGTIIDGLENIETREGKIEKIQMIIDKLNRLAEGISLAPEDLVKHCNDANHKIAAISKMYCAALRAINVYNGDLSMENEDFDSIEEYLKRPQDIANNNVRVVGYMFLRSANIIADKVTERYAPIRLKMAEFYKKKGYSKIENSVIGDLARVFRNLYEEDDLGNKIMRFKNPYNPSARLDDDERLFLKEILFELNKIRYEMLGREFDFTGINDLRLIDTINDADYLEVPLERASKATRRLNMKQGFTEFFDRWKKRITHPKLAFEEFTEDLLTEEAKELRNRDIKNLSAYNPFTPYENRNGGKTESNARNRLLNMHDFDYFETNVENLFIDYLEKHILSVEYNKMLTRTKGVLLDLYLRGETEGDLDNIKRTVKTIEDYLDVSVFNHSIMEDSSKKIDGIIAPIRRAVSTCYIAASPVAAMRDTFQGLLENTVAALNKFLNDLDASDVAFGYNEVFKEGCTNAMSITKLNQFNLKYRFSNIDIARISEGQKTGRGGILNYENWMYSTMRRPDYVNRMVLFSAKMHHDGVTNAYSIVNGKLQYDYRKDKRFKHYVENDTNSEEYYKERALYLSLLRAFNKENDSHLSEGDLLPDAYTMDLIQSFKTFADNIYGSYNQSLRAKYENTAIGINFLPFSTWFNGIIDVYSKKPQISKSQVEWKLATDVNGNKLYFDNNMNILTLEEGGNDKLPVMEDTPVMVLGIWYTLTDTFKALKEGGYDSFKSDIWQYDVQRQNLRKLLSHLIVGGLLAAIFKFWLDDEYSTHKSKDNGKHVIQNALIEMTYKAGSNCWDGFKGPLTVIDYFGNSTNPASYKLMSRVSNDLYNYVFGEKTLGLLAIGSQALPRSFKDTYDMWVRDNQ